MRRFLLVPLLAAVAACAPDPAPADLDGLSRWFWLNYDEAEPEQVADAVAKLDKAIEGLELPVQATIARLAKADLAVVKLDANDPTKANGLLAITSIPCTLAKLEPLIYATNQDVLHPDTYDKYKRTHTSDLASYEARTTPTLTWTTDISASPLGYGYSETINGGVRFVAAADGKGPFLLSRTVLPTPAKFEDADNFFRQDYQIEAYYEKSPGRVIHLFAVWREMEVGAFSTEDDTFVNIQLDNFVKWDEVFEELCK